MTAKNLIMLNECKLQYIKNSIKLKAQNITSNIRS